MPAPQSLNLAKLQKEAQEFGIALDRDDDGTYWGRAPSGLELGGYETATTALEDLKAVVTLDGARDLFSYEDDPDVAGTYRVTYLKDNMVFNDPALAVALSDALSYHTTQSAPAPAPKRGTRTRRPDNGSVTIEAKAEPTVEETLPDEPKQVQEASVPRPKAATKVAPEPVFHEPSPTQEAVTKGLIRSEEASVRTPDTITPQQQISTALLQIAAALTEVANNLGNEAMLPLGSAFEEPEQVKPARNRRSSN